MKRRIQWEDVDKKLPTAWLEECVSHLRGGGIAILPTETGYMMAVDGLNEVALDFLYETKGRPEGRATHLAVSSLEAANRVSKLGERGMLWFEKFSPGPLTVISKAKSIVPAQILGPEGTIGVRFPDHEGTLAILDRLDSSLTATSANYAGAPHELKLERILEQFPESTWKQWFILQHDSRKYTMPSTMVLDGHTDFQLLRKGPISRSQLMKALKD